MKIPLIRIPLFAAACVALATSALAADRVRYDAQPGSKVKIDGTSTIHDWTVEGQIIGGFMEWDASFPADLAKAVKANPKVEVTIPVRSLKSGNKKMDSVMLQAMKVEGTKNAAIKYRLLEITLKEPAKTPDGAATCEAKGELTVSGVTRTNMMTITLQPVQKDSVKITGTSAMKMTDFQIVPPSLVGLLDTGDPVKVTIEWLTARSAEAAKTAEAK